MEYTINRYDGTQLVKVLDATIDNTTCDLTLIGRNYAGYGEAQNENFLHLLENFAKNVQPNYPIRGQIWYDTAARKLKFYDGAEFRSTVRMETSSIKPTYSNKIIGDFWFDTTNLQLKAWDGTDFVVVGPEQSLITGLSKVRVRSVRDTSNNPHVIIEAVIEDEVIFIVSSDTFTLNNEDAISGFSLIYKGVTLVNSSVLASNSIKTGYFRKEVLSDTLDALSISSYGVISPNKGSAINLSNTVYINSSASDIGMIVMGYPSNRDDIPELKDVQCRTLLGNVSGKTIRLGYFQTDVPSDTLDDLSISSYGVDSPNKGSAINLSNTVYINSNAPDIGMIVMGYPASRDDIPPLKDIQCRTLLGDVVGKTIKLGYFRTEIPADTLNDLSISSYGVEEANKGSAINLSNTVYINSSASDIGMIVMGYPSNRDDIPELKDVQCRTLLGNVSGKTIKLGYFQTEVPSDTLNDLSISSYGVEGANKGSAINLSNTVYINSNADNVGMIVMGYPASRDDIPPLKDIQCRTLLGNVSGKTIKLGYFQTEVPSDTLNDLSISSYGVEEANKGSAINLSNTVYINSNADNVGMIVMGYPASRDDIPPLKDIQCRTLLGNVSGKTIKLGYFQTDVPSDTLDDLSISSYGVEEANKGSAINLSNTVYINSSASDIGLIVMGYPASRDDIPPLKDIQCRTLLGNVEPPASDTILKENVTPLSYGLAELLSIKPVTFNWVDSQVRGTQREIGVIAQEIQKCIPELVSMRHDGFFGVDYAKLSVVAVQAIQELKKEYDSIISKLQAEIDQLKET